MNLYFSIPIKPKPYARPRFNGLHKHIFDAPDYSAYLTSIRFAAQQAMKDNHLHKFAGNCAAEVKFFKNIKNPASKRFGDLDNLLKALFDGLNNIVFLDDSQIVQLSAQKFYDVDERIDIKIWEVP